MVLPPFLHRWATRLQTPTYEQKISDPSETEDSPSSDTSDTMGKSNKFDFTNRSSSGVKLGKSIGQSLEKEASKIQKDAAKQAAKASRQSSGSSGHDGDGSGSSDYKEHCIDLQAPNKQLGDAGFAHVAAGLQKALRSGDGQILLVLEDLNLSGNQLSTASLVALAPILDLARHNLKTLNLANNAITVVDDVQAQEWETLLTSFRHCYKLRRLDLSSNSLGMTAFEIFARVHAGEAPVDPRSISGETSVLSLGSAVSTTSDQSLPSTTYDAHADNTNPLAMGQILRRRQGLRSIPYITLQNVDLDDGGALWLSYVIQDHYYPVQLVDFLNASTASSSVKAYQQDSNQNGIDYTENDGLSKDAVCILEYAEAMRRRANVDDHAMTSSTSFDNLAGDAHRVVTDKNMGRAVSGSRRISIRSVSTTDGVEQEVLESIRKKVQRHLIQQHGFPVVKVWNASFTLFWATRKLAYLAPSKRQIQTDEPVIHDHTPAPSRYTTSSTSSNHSFPRTPHHSRQSSDAATLLASPGGPCGKTELAITETTNSPAIPPQMISKTQRKGGFSEGADALKYVTNRLMGTVLTDDVKGRFITYQQRRLGMDAEDGKIYRDKSHALHLPRDVMSRILQEAVGETDWYMLSKKQRNMAIAWGLDKKTLGAEALWAKHATSYQVWTLLEKIQGLEYVAE